MMMKKNSLAIPLFALCLLACLVTSCNRKKERVASVLKAISFEHELVVNRLDALERSLESYVPSTMDRTYQDALTQLDSSAKVIGSLESLPAEDDLRDDAMLLFDTYRILLENEYMEIVKRQKKPAGTFTVADEFVVKNLGRHIEVNRKRAREKFEREAALVYGRYEIPFKPVAEEAAEVTSSKTPGSGSPAQ